MSAVDVVVPCYRYGHYLRQCVESVLAQADVEVRVLVIDDCSPDDTPQVGMRLASEDARVSFRRHPCNLGHIATYNEGIEWAESEYVLLLSADDYLMDGALSRAKRLLDEEPSMTFCFGNAMELDADHTLTPVRIAMRASRPLRSHAMAGGAFIEMSRCSGSVNLVPTPTAVVRTALQKRLGGYRPELPHTGDLEMWWRLAAHGSVGFVAATQAVYRRHASNMSLAYMGANRLADLHQRREAVDRFCGDCRHVLPDADALRFELLRPLVLDAVSRASAALNGDQPETSGAFIAFAVETDPGVVRTMPWLRLACKRRLGARASRPLRSALALLRRMVARMRSEPGGASSQ